MSLYVRNVISKENIALSLIFLFPVFSSVAAHAGTSIFALLMLWGLVWGWNSHQILTVDEKRIVWGFIIFFLVIILSLINTTDYSMAAKKIERYLRVIGIIPVFYLLVRLNLDIYKIFRIGLIISACILFSAGIYDMAILNKPYMEGAYYTTLFGYVSVLNAFMLIAVLLTTKLTKLEYGLSLAAVLVLLNCAIFSQSRASWVGAIAIALFLFALYIFKLRIKVTLKHSIFPLVIIVLLVVLNLEQISNRINSGVKDVEIHDSTYASTTSLGIRLNLWKDSIALFLDSPILGTGVGDFDFDRNKMIDAGLTTETESYGHSHNQFLSSLATTGILGFAGLLVGVFILPFWYFWKIFSAAKNEQTRYFSLMGMIVLIGFAFFGIGEVWLARNPTSNVYAILIAISLAGIVNSRRQLNDKN